MDDLTIQADHRELRQLRPWLVAQVPSLDSELIGRVELCIHELAANVIDHSGALQLSLSVSSQPPGLAVELHDGGAPLPTSIGDPEPHPRVRGYGMMIAEALATELSYERRPGLNVWRARFDFE